MAAVSPPRLIGLSPGNLLSGDGRGHQRFRKRAKDLVQAGLRGILLREPQLEDLELLELARELALILSNVEGGWLGVHDALHVALAAKAHGAHIGFRSLATADARRVIGSDIALGVSTHQSDVATHWTGADYVFHSPVFATPSKNGFLHPIGLDGLVEFCSAEGMPKPGPLIFALGGINAGNCTDVMKRGAAAGLFGLAVRGALFVDDHARDNLSTILAAIVGNQELPEG